jgi:hypothetical protein
MVYWVDKQLRHFQLSRQEYSTVMQTFQFMGASVLGTAFIWDIMWPLVPIL